jgi:glycosyltransferase involved in cell wall biosynthesis
LLEEIRNLIMRLIRASMADHIVYQSRFAKDWWERTYGKPEKGTSIIYNGADLAQFSPDGPRYQSKADICIISVEGTQGADPFDIAIQVGRSLEERGRKVELLMFGTPWNNAQSQLGKYPFINFMGTIANSQLPYFYRGATFYLSTDIIAACPNSVIEALACGTPVLGYKAGVLPEMLGDRSAGRCIECDGDPWKGESPANLEGMVNAALEIAKNTEPFRVAARRLAEERYGLDQMVDAYMEVLLGSAGT